MAQREARTNRRQEPPRKGGRGGLFSGLMIGLVVGLVVAAGLAWYINSHPAFHPSEQAHVPEVSKPMTREQPAEGTLAKPSAQALPSAQPKMNYTFYGILPGEKPAKPVEPPPPSDNIWWLQVAALKIPAEADRLKARLALLGLPVVTQKFDLDKQTLYRVRIGPYKRQDDALTDIDTLAANQFEHRLIKEPANH